MSDDALRRLARRWRATRDPTDEARLLAERLRSGDLEPARLELAAYLGQGPAQVVVGVPDQPRPEPWLAAVDEGAPARSWSGSSCSWPRHGRAGSTLRR